MLFSSSKALSTSVSILVLICVFSQVLSSGQHHKIRYSAQQDKANDLGNEDALIFYIDSPKIKRIPGNNIQQTIKNWKGIHLVFMGSGECEHCQEYGGKFQKLGLKLMKSSKKVTWNYVDCKYDDKACAKLGVTAWPAFFIYKDGKQQKKYMGKKEARKSFSNIKNFAVHALEK